MKKQIVEAINAEKYEFVVGEGVMESAHNYAMDKAIDIINDLIPDDSVLVPRADIENLATWYLQDHIETNLAVEAVLKQGEK